MLHALHAIRHAFAGNVVFERQQVLIAVPTGDPERGAAHQHARSGDIAGVNGIPQGHVAETLGSHVAYRGETGFQGDARVAGARSGLRGERKSREPAGRRPVDCRGRWVCASVRPGKTVALPRSMKRSLGGAIRLCHGTDADNLASLDHNGLIGESFAAANVKQLTGMDHDATGSRSGGVLRLSLSEWGQQRLGHQPLENECAQRHTDCGKIRACLCSSFAPHLF